MEYRPSTPRDLAEVFRNIDQRMTEEYVTAGYSPRLVKSWFRSAIDDGRGHTLFGVGGLLAVVVWQFHDGAIETGFAAKPEFFDRKYVRACRTHIRVIQTYGDNLPVRSISYASHPHLTRWFSALGFAKVSTAGPSTIYQLAPQS